MNAKASARSSPATVALSPSPDRRRLLFAVTAAALATATAVNVGMIAKARGSELPAPVSTSVAHFDDEQEDPVIDLIREVDRKREFRDRLSGFTAEHIEAERDYLDALKMAMLTPPVSVQGAAVLLVYSALHPDLYAPHFALMAFNVAEFLALGLGYQR